MKNKISFIFVFLFLLAIPFSFASISNSSLYVYIPMNESSGTTAKDWGSLKSDAETRSGTCSAVPTPYGYGRMNDASCYMNFSKEIGLNDATNWTLSIMINRTGTNGWAFSGQGTVVYDRVLIGDENTDDYASVDGSSWGLWNSKGITYPLNTWTCYSIIFNGTHYRFYNGVTQNDSLTSSTKILNWTNPHFFRAQSSTYWTGILSQFAIFKNRVLSISEIADFCQNHSFLGVDSIVLNYKQPSDINQTNVIISGNISFNATAGVNKSNVKLFFKTNNSITDCTLFVNGVSYCGYQNKTSQSVSNLTFNFTENDVYPATYNIHPSVIDNVQNINVSIGNNNAFLKNRFYNVSASNNYLILEAMVTNFSQQALKLWLCNSSYTSGLVTSSPYCTNFYDLAPQEYSHCHTNFSCHYIIPINKDNQSVNGIKITSTLYILYQGGTSWSYFYINNNTNSVQATVTGGNSWTNLPVTINQHIHQFNGNDTFYFYASDGSVTSPLYSDILELSALPPSAVQFYSPLFEDTFDNELFLVNYSNATSSYSAISGYYSYLVDSSFAIKKILQSNVTNNNSFYLNSTDYPNGDYYIRVDAFDLNNLSTSSYSDLFTISNSVYVLPRTTAEALDSFTKWFFLIMSYLFCVIAYSIFLFFSGNGTKSFFILLISWICTLIPAFLGFSGFIEAVIYFIISLFGIIVISELISGS